jgi:hypothetical protein
MVDHRKHWNLDTGPGCVLCVNKNLETRHHLFFKCDCASQYWDFLEIHWNLAKSLSDRANFVGPFFMEVFACATRNIWRVRKDFIFMSSLITFNRWKLDFQSDLLLHGYKVKSATVQPLYERVFSIFL